MTSKSKKWEEHVYQYIYTYIYILVEGCTDRSLGERGIRAHLKPGFI